MKSISFDNPYLLILWIPLALIVFASFFIAVRKESRTRDAKLSLVLHTLIVTFSVLAAAGLTYTSVITKTEVVVVADVSYSASEKLDTVDERIRELRDSFIGNTDMAVVTFGGGYELTTAFGDRFGTVRDSKVNKDSTDIAAALNYAATLFSDNSIKRVVLITDAMSTGESDNDGVIAAVNSLYAASAQVDAIFLDSNLGEGVREVQVNSVDYIRSAYLGRTTAAEALITSSDEMRSIVELYRNNKLYAIKTVNLTEGFNLVSFDIKADSEGVFDYSLRVRPEGDVTAENNRVDFVQSVTGELRVLLITSRAADLARAELLYGGSATIDLYNSSKKNNKFSLPYTVEELVKYDEILISDVNLLELPNYSELINSIDTVVSEFGKSLVTFGNNNIQNKEEDIFKKLENMLPVSYGNNKRDSALITFIVDCSKSMNTAGRLNTTREMMKEMLDLLDPKDKVCIISFYADNYVEQPPTEVGDKSKLIDIIDNHLIPKQGTVIGSAIDRAYREMRDLDYSKKMAILISDGLSFKKVSEDDTALTSAASMYANGIVVSTVNMWSASDEAVSLMESVAALGGGTAYYIENERDYSGKIKTEFADELTESVINRPTEVVVNIPKDDVMAGVDALPEINGFVNSKIKDNATTVLSVFWEKDEYATLEIPLYAYWDYGNGRVATLNTSFSGEWVSEWTTQSASRFMSNLVATGIPEQRHEYPFTVNITEEGTVHRIELIPQELNIDAVAKLTLTSPLGVVTEHEMVFDSTKYVISVGTASLGRYDVAISYECPGREPYTASLYFNLSYYKEYDSFLVYSDTLLHDAIRNRGKVVGEGEIPTYEYDESLLTTYVVHFTLPLLIAACVLFVLDVIVRKLTASDIKNLFKKIKGR
ncbi:MAG: VWA domain-containing protein [Clostridia bacterium]|nr:VWA domain-containing protein [Clostridia bacterium]